MLPLPISSKRKGIREQEELTIIAAHTECQFRWVPKRAIPNREVRKPNQTTATEGLFFLLISSLRLSSTGH